MNEILESLASIPGVRTVVLTSQDGVPICVRGRARERQEEGNTGWLDATDNPEAFAALAAGWLGNLSKSVAALSWNAPEQLVLIGTRGTIVMHNTGTAILIVTLDDGARPEDLTLPMKSVVARLERTLRSMGSANRTAPTPTGVARPSGIFPGESRQATYIEHGTTGTTAEIPGE